MFARINLYVKLAPQLLLSSFANQTPPLGEQRFLLLAFLIPSSLLLDANPNHTVIIFPHFLFLLFNIWLPCHNILYIYLTPTKSLLLREK
ncbi:hypothetical protein BCR43DRAFT_164005 [Syncephalastrum racemosum]|uniref:Uncharacterized protein n=1 Tax=Syncephalastrum racemosum TaxID=13706 RepID=A0A1X2HQ53_SYNRA|nr:hypothetical protein BCR43DRAFT_164005 [Syncephalastrum racemosum]